MTAGRMTGSSGRAGRATLPARYARRVVPFGVRAADTTGRPPPGAHRRRGAALQPVRVGPDENLPRVGLPGISLSFSSRLS